MSDQLKGQLPIERETERERGREKERIKNMSRQRKMCKIAVITFEWLLNNQKIPSISI